MESRYYSREIIEDSWDDYAVQEEYLKLLHYHFPIGKKIAYLGIEAVVSYTYLKHEQYGLDTPLVGITYLNSYGEITNYKMEETEIEFYMRKFEEKQK